MVTGPTYPPLDWERVARRLAGRRIGDPVIYRSRIDSTNTLAAALAPDPATNGAVVIAEYQTAGRGRLGRRWLARPASGLTCTVVLGPFDPAWAAPMIAGLAVVDALATLAIQAVLKWPNDVLVAGRKCAGILIESKKVRDASWLLAGIGINVREADPALPTATFLDAHAGHAISREDLLIALLELLAEWRERAGAYPAQVRAAWCARLDTLGKAVRVQTPGGRVQGLAEGVEDDGALIVRLADGTARAVRAGDVTLSDPIAHLGDPSGSGATFQKRVR